MKPEGTPFALAPDIVDFALLDQGKMIFVHARSELNPDRKQSYEAFFWNPESKVAWNLLEGVERLPPLAPEFQKFSYIEDKIKITLIESSQKHPKWGRFVLAIFRHFRGDLRSFVWNSQEKAIKRTFWQRAILLTSKGQRYLLDLFAEENLPDQLWLHSSGKIFSVNFVWNTEGSDSQRSFQLSEKTFSCP